MKRKFVKTICLFCLSFALAKSSIGQSNFSTKEFWSVVQLNYDYNQMDAGMRAALLEIAKNETNSLTDGMAMLENMSKDSVVQDKIFLNLYTMYPQKNSENLRMVLGTMSGRYSLGNPVADYIYRRYSNDVRAQKIIEENRRKLIEENKKNAMIAEKKRKMEEWRMESAEADMKNRQLEEKKKELRKEWESNIGDTKTALSQDLMGWNVMYGSSYPHWIFSVNNRNTTPPKLLKLRGDNVWGKFLESEGIQQPERASFEVIVSFVVNAEGNTENEHIELSEGEPYDSKAIEIIKKTSGKWKPAKAGRHNTNYVLCLPVFF